MLLLLRESANIAAFLDLLKSTDTARLCLLVLKVLKKVGIARRLRVLLDDLVGKKL